MFEEQQALQLIRDVVVEGRILWRHHALERLLERGISRAEVLGVLKTGEIIEMYPTDRPFPSYLIMSVEGPPLHVLAAVDAGTRTCHVITAYRPDIDRFGPDLKTRRNK